MIPIPASLRTVLPWPQLLFGTAIVSGVVTLLALALVLFGLLRKKSRTFCMLWAAAAVAAGFLCYLVVTGRLITMV